MFIVRKSINTFNCHVKNCAIIQNYKKENNAKEYINNKLNLSNSEVKDIMKYLVEEVMELRETVQELNCRIDDTINRINFDNQ